MSRDCARLEYIHITYKRLYIYKDTYIQRYIHTYILYILHALISQALVYDVRTAVQYSTVQYSKVHHDHVQTYFVLGRYVVDLYIYCLES